MSKRAKWLSILAGLLLFVGLTSAASAVTFAAKVTISLSNGGGALPVGDPSHIIQMLTPGTPTPYLNGDSFNLTWSGTAAQNKTQITYRALVVEPLGNLQGKVRTFTVTGTPSPALAPNTLDYTFATVTVALRNDGVPVGPPSYLDIAKVGGLADGDSFDMPWDAADTYIAHTTPVIAGPSTKFGPWPAGGGSVTLTVNYATVTIHLYNGAWEPAIGDPSWFLDVAGLGPQTQGAVIHVPVNAQVAYQAHFQSLAGPTQFALFTSAGAKTLNYEYATIKILLYNGRTATGKPKELTNPDIFVRMAPDLVGPINSGGEVHIPAGVGVSFVPFNTNALSGTPTSVSALPGDQLVSIEYGTYKVYLKYKVPNGNIFALNNPAEEYLDVQPLGLQLVNGDVFEVPPGGHFSVTPVTVGSPVNMEGKTDDMVGTPGDQVITKWWQRVVVKFKNVVGGPLSMDIISVKNADVVTNIPDGGVGLFPVGARFKVMADLGPIQLGPFGPWTFANQPGLLQFNGAVVQFSY